MPKKTASYPRRGRLALGDSQSLPGDVDRLLKKDAAARKAKQTVNVAKEIADLLDDAFQCGVVIQDRRSGTQTPLKRDRDIRKMHLARASHILWDTRKEIGDDDINLARRAYLIRAAGAQSVQNGMGFSMYGVRILEPMFSLEPTTLWRDVPSRYDYEMRCVVRSKLEAEELGVDLPLTKEDPETRDWFEVAGVSELKREMGIERSMEIDGDDGGAAFLSDACIRALCKAGMLTVVETDAGKGVVPTQAAIDAWLEYRPWFNESRSKLKAQREAELREMNHPMVYDWSVHPSEDGPQVCRLFIDGYGFWDAMLPCHPRMHVSSWDTYFEFCGKVLIGSGYAHISQRYGRADPEDVALGLAITLAVHDMPGMGCVPPGSGFKPKAPGQQWTMHQLEGNPDTIYLRTFEKTRPETIKRWSRDNDVVFIPVMEMPNGRTLYVHSTQANVDALMDVKDAILAAVADCREYGLRRAAAPS